MNLKISLGAAVALILMVAAAVFSATMVYSQYTFNLKATDLERSRNMYEKFSEVDRTVRENYGGTINENTLMDNVAQGYIAGLGDKYSAYLSAETVKRLEGVREGEDIGIGAALAIAPGGYLLVTEVYPDSPAQNAEIAAGDLIIRVDETDITPENVEDMRVGIQGEAGTRLSLVVRKGNEDVAIPDLTRRAVAIPSVYSRVIEGENVGYIGIRQFNDNTADQFARELLRVQEGGATSLIIDVRDNPGTTYGAAVRILDRLTPEGIIYSAAYRDGTVQVVEQSDANELIMPMTVLVNAGTAEAAELFAQDLKDFGKAEIVGSLTAGKGVLLDRIKLSDGSAIDLTVAVINSMSGYVYDGAGVKPDFDVALDGGWQGLDETTDAQLKKAVEVVTAQLRAVETAQAESEASVAPEISELPAQPVSTPPESAPPQATEPDPAPDPDADPAAETDPDLADEPPIEDPGSPTEESAG